ncbi:MAG: cytochrome c [Micropepsaceae bacterium]
MTSMTRERFQWILAGIIIGIAFAVLGINTSMSNEKPTSGQDLVDYREKRLKAAGGAMQALSQYDGSDAAAAQAAAKTVDDVAGELLSFFPEGSGPGGAGIEETRAKPEIWSDWAGFEARAKALDDAATLLTAAAAANDLGALGEAARQVGAACKACHQDYRGPEN